MRSSLPKITATLLCSLLLASCGGSSDPNENAGSPAEPAAGETGTEETPDAAEEAAGPMSIEEGNGLDRGRYRTSNFRPGFTFKVPDYEWVGDVDRKDIVALFINNSDWRNEVAFMNPTKLSDPKSGRLIKAPDDLLGYFRSHPYLKVLSEGTTKVGNVSGPYVEIALARYPTESLPGCDGEKCFPLVQNSVFNWGFVGDKTHADVARIIELDVGGDDLLVTVAAMEKESDFRSAFQLPEMLKAAKPILSSVEFAK